MASAGKLRGFATASAAVAAATAGRALARWRAACAPSFAVAAPGWTPALAPGRGVASATASRAQAAAAANSGDAASAARSAGANRPVVPLAAGAALGAAARMLAAGRRRRSALLPRGARLATKARGGEQSAVSQIDFRVGQIVSCERHPDSDKLLVEMIDIGEGEPRQICSGIAAWKTPEDVVGKKVVIVSNLKERKMAGTPSNGMLLCATKGEDEDRVLDLVEAPAGAEVGERVVIEVEGEEHGDAAPPNRVAKKKLYEKVAPELCADADGTVCFMKSPFTTSAGPCTASLKDSIVS